jgi:hypothetical protein
MHHAPCTSSKNIVGDNQADTAELPHSTPATPPLNSAIPATSSVPAILSPLSLQPRPSWVLHSIPRRRRHRATRKVPKQHHNRQCTACKRLLPSQLVAAFSCHKCRRHNCLHAVRRGRAEPANFAR